MEFKVFKVGKFDGDWYWNKKVEEHDKFQHDPECINRALLKRLLGEEDHAEDN